MTVIESSLNLIVQLHQTGSGADVGLRALGLSPISEFGIKQVDEGQISTVKR